MLPSLAGSAGCSPPHPARSTVSAKHIGPSAGVPAFSHRSPPDGEDAGSATEVATEPAPHRIHEHCVFAEDDSV
ncbi:hypothetical protein, partial [uncultured Actinomyces sp.]|uniref:hypothetical protein n=1 Tax=uncultured Actinomyces sp. TaxID=249061 RepID=UPI0028D59460